MLILDSTTRSLEVVLADSAAANQLPMVACYIDFTDGYTPGASHTQTNNTTAVTVVAAPASGAQRHVKFLSLRNSDTAPATATLRYNDNATLRIIVTVTLAVGDTLLYTDGEGFRVLDSNGNVKSGSSNLPTTTKGDLIVHNGSANVRLPIGTNGQVLTADSVQPTGVKWAASSGVSAATQAEMEAASSTTVYVSPGRTQYHPGVAKGWVSFNGTGTVAIGASHNVSSITDNGVGDYTVNWSTPFSSADYAVILSVRRDTSSNNVLAVVKGAASNPTAGSVTIKTVNISVTAIDVEYVAVAAWGDQ